jgi:carbamoyl-phosphate synthase small subunit
MKSTGGGSTFFCLMDVAKLALENGSVFTGTAFGGRGESEGEVVFNTSMTGYQEILTDPSYHGQIVVMTYPLIGNYGINSEDAESRRAWVRGFVVRELSGRVSNYRSQQSLEGYLEEQAIIGIEGVDTRALVRLTRTHGALRGILSTVDLNDASLVERARASRGMLGADLTRDVMPSVSTKWQVGLSGEAPAADVTQTRRPHVVALDFGMKRNIARYLVETGCDVTVVPGSTPAEAILEHKPDGILISNGPGDPEPLVEATSTLRSLIKTGAESRGIPIFGICLGHQLLGLAFGGKTFKLKFGHRGANHPVRDEQTGKVEITTQNHGFSVDPASLPSGVIVSHTNLNDGTLEGLRHERLPIFSVQYHPEAAAGPHDSRYLFDDFRRLMG